MNASPFRKLEPPAGGWERLVHRRDKESWPTPMAALAGAVAIFAFALFWPHRHPIDFRLNGARLIGERSEGSTLRMLDGRRAIALRSEDPNIELYWIDGRQLRKTRLQTS
jgi:hypothetical protein